MDLDEQQIKLISTAITSATEAHKQVLIKLRERLIVEHYINTLTDEDKSAFVAAGISLEATLKAFPSGLSLARIRLYGKYLPKSVKRFFLLVWENAKGASQTLKNAIVFFIVTIGRGLKLLFENSIEILLAILRVVFDIMKSPLEWLAPRWKQLGNKLEIYTKISEQRQLFPIIFAILFLLSCVTLSYIALPITRLEVAGFLVIFTSVLISLRYIKKKAPIHLSQKTPESKVNTSRRPFSLSSLTAFLRPISISPQNDGEKSQALIDQNIIHLLGVEDATEEEKEDFLDEVQHVIWEDFLENDIDMLLTEERTVEFKKIADKQGLEDDALQAEMVEYLEKVIPDLEKIMLEKALELKEEMMRERTTQMMDEYQDENVTEKMAKVKEALELMDDDKWHSAADLLNSIPA